ncbi:unnamed protein product [Nippostrongylus brasiliensis]|uniref:Early endosome antigen 1 (inferred by orthology to a human protein) n=1 Tax=Nippostrongylus brasiliensis TaxID=27835 RepID=A0A158R0V5_NIPBR|nr:unnamed protein product [Nippostrongylus brasiliensis]
MLRRLKAQVSQVANELPGVLSPTGRDGRDGVPFFPVTDSQNNVDDEIEGFLCPICMGTFNAPELLSAHFEEAHNKDVSVISNPNFEFPMNSQSSEVTSSGSFNSKDKEIEELRLQIKEEQTYAGKLKEELDRIQSVVAQATDVPEGEVPYLMQQIQVLEAGKSMVTQRMLEFEKENGQLKRFTENSQQEKAEIMNKLKQLSSQIRILTDENEGNKVEKEFLQKELATCKSEREKLDKEMDVLNKALDQRPSEDDVAVLRKELIHAQTLMDEISQQKDVEISEHLNSIRQLNMEREKQRCVMENLQKQLQDTGSHSEETSEKVRCLTTELEDTRQLLLTCQKDLEDAKSDSFHKGKRVEELHGKVEANLTELASCREKIAQLEETVRMSAREIDDSHAMNEKNVAKLTLLSDKLEQVIEEKKRYEAEMTKFEEKNEVQSNSIRSLEMSNMDLTNELSSLGSLLEHERKLIDEKNKIITAKDEELFATKEELERAQATIDKLTNQSEVKVTEVETLTKQLVTLQENSRELMDRISKGEDGANTVMTQLKDENQKLREEITQATNAHKEEKEGFLAKISELEKSSREERKVAAEKLKKAEEQKESLERHLREAEDDVNRKAERFVEMEKEIEEDRRKANERTNKLKEIVRVKETSVLEARKQLEELSAQLSEKNRVLREKEHQLEENRRKIEESVARLADAEAKAWQLEAELSQSEAQRVAMTDSEIGLRSQLSENETFMASLKEQVEKVFLQLTTELNAKEQALRDANAEFAEKEEHWKKKREEFELQLEKDHEHNEELLATVRELQISLESEKNESASRQAKIDSLNVSLEETSRRVSELDAEVEKKNEAIDDLSKTVKQLNDSLAEERSRGENARKKYEDEVVLLKSVENALCDAKLELDNVQKRSETRQAELESLVDQLGNEKEQLTASLDAKDEELRRVKTLNDRLQEDLNNKTVELDEFHDRMAKFESEIADERRKLESLEVERQGALEECVALRTQNVEASKLSDGIIEQLKKEKDELRGCLEEKEKELNSVQTRCAQFEQLSKDIQLSKDRELSSKAAEIERLLSNVAEVESVAASKEAKLTEEISSLKRSIRTIQSELDEQVRLCAEASKATEELTSANMELSRKVSSWEEEKNALIERCLNTESDLDFERDRALENKRRFDEALSAMHELGRANQSLQMDISKHSSRTWLDDSAAINCTSCGKVFSLTVRKHHCRVCGLIFCNPCSAKTTQIASHKNPVRVCDNCFTEVQNRMRFLALLILSASTLACVHKNEKYKDGDTWVVRSTFVMKCKINRDGSWSTKVIGCRTPSGVVVQPGRSLKEGDTTYECMVMTDGRVEIKRTYQFNKRQQSCEGHRIGESWVSQHNFRKVCTEAGARISECLTDAGITVPLNQNLVLSGIVYTCTRLPDGTVSINREGLPAPSNFKSNLLQPEEEQERGPKKVAPAPQRHELPHSLPPAIAPPAISCVSSGVTYRPEETWVSENKFTKKCTPDGSIIILNCLLDDKTTTINVNTELKIGKKTYKCYRNKSEGRVFFEVRTE